METTFTLTIHILELEKKKSAEKKCRKGWEFTDYQFNGVTVVE